MVNEEEPKATEPNDSVDEVMETIDRRRERLLAKRGGIPFESSVDLIREAREERMQQLARALGWAESSDGNAEQSGESANREEQQCDAESD